jgi:uncharacterized DUF497 family protein
VLYVWDRTKARKNQQKHGVSLEEAVPAFADPLALITDDDLHPDRAILTGMSSEARILVVVFAPRDEEEVRLISARRATRSERRHYEEGE